MVSRLLDTVSGRADSDHHDRANQARLALGLERSIRVQAIAVQRQRLIDEQRLLTLPREPVCEEKTLSSGATA